MKVKRRRLPGVVYTEDDFHRRDLTRRADAPPGRTIAEAIDTAERVFPGADWLFGKGKVNPDEPLYGFRVFNPGTEDILAEGEHDDPVECVMQALDPSRRGRAQ